MEKENNLKEELIKQMDGDPSEAIDTGVNWGSKIIEKYKTQLRRRKYIAITGWLVTIIYAIAIHNLKVFLLKENIDDILSSNAFWLLRWSDTCLIVLTMIALLLTYLYYSMSRAITILQISARLGKIEEYLKQISQDK
jgi:hypothetical protein